MKAKDNIGQQSFNSLTRRATFALAALIATPAVTSAVPSLAAKPAVPEENNGYFNHPAEYLAAMQAIGWRPVAMYQRLEGGGVHRMGVAEYGGDEASIQKSWVKHHAISMRACTRECSPRR